MKFCEFVRSFLSAVYIPSFQLHIVYPDSSDLPVAKLSQWTLKQNLSKLGTTQVRVDFRLGNIGTNCIGGYIVGFVRLCFNREKLKSNIYLYKILRALLPKEHWYSTNQKRMNYINQQPFLLMLDI
jgi:hypothetical protein